MKKGILIAVLLCLCLGAASKKAPKYWQDTILKPEQAWIEAYGYNNESVLAYNVRSLIRIAQQQEIVITALKNELDSVDIHKFIPIWPDSIELDKNLVIDMPDDHSIGIYEMILEKGTKIYFKDPNEVEKN